jgi:hypothetical protein
MPILNEIYKPRPRTTVNKTDKNPVIKRDITPNKGVIAKAQPVETKKEKEHKSSLSDRPEEVLTQQTVTKTKTSCDFCGHEEKKENLREVVSINSKYSICPNCYKYFQQKQCIICHKPLNEQKPHQNFEWKGLCFNCAQLVMMKATKLKQEIDQGVDFDSSMEVVNNRDKELTEEEFNTLLSVAKPFLNSVKTR